MTINIPENVYLRLTKEFNAGRLRAVISSGQAVVLHRIAIMSKDGDWIIREDIEATGHILHVLAGYGATYRFGAPLDVRWLAHGWSSHFEFRYQGLRVRTDFVSRPPRTTVSELRRLWEEQEGRDIPFVDLRSLARLKQTNREKDYAVIGELARQMTDGTDQLLFSRSARDLIELAGRYPQRVKELASRRPLLAVIPQGREALERALDAERRALMRENEERLLRYEEAAKAWAAVWPQVSRLIEHLPLADAHRIMRDQAEPVLPFGPIQCPPKPTSF
jgi:hypothetical protein